MSLTVTFVPEDALEPARERGMVWVSLEVQSDHKGWRGQALMITPKPRR